VKNNSYNQEKIMPKLNNHEPLPHSAPTVKNTELNRYSVVRKTSTYQASSASEVKRLSLQADYMAPFDKLLLDSAVQFLPDRPLTVLDVGCGEGTVTLNRFTHERFGTVIGVDRNIEALNIAESKTSPDDKFYFIQSDMDVEDLTSTVEQKLDELGLKKVDLIFAAYAIHHMSHPVKVLQACCNLLSPEGVIVVRTPDDEADVAYPDPNNNFARIIELTKTSPGVSDRLHGRKLYTQLYEAGFNNILVKYNIIDTASLNAEEKAELFNIKFSYRADYLKRAAQANPKNINLATAHQEIINRLEEFETEFQQPHFFYNAVDLGAIAQNNPTL
jgi:SAM-dependent methyltransferase